jgi:biotin carboxylase
MKQHPEALHQRLLLIVPANSYRTLAYLESARRLGVDVLIASEGKYSLVAEIAAGLNVDLTAPDAHRVLLKAHRQQPFTGVVATDDGTVELASRVAESIGLPHNPLKAARLSRRKDLARQALFEAGVPVPDFRVIDLDQPLAKQLAGVDYPIVVKPLSLSASRGVIRADNENTALEAIRRVQKILENEGMPPGFDSRHVLVEAFMPGKEVAVEGILHRGELDVLAIFDKPDPLDGPYFEETYYITPSRQPDGTRQQITGAVRMACKALGLREGPVHAELRLQGEQCRLVEVAARSIGGDCARLLRFGTGQGLEDLVISHAIGKPLQREAETGGAGVLMIPINEAGILRRIEGISRARQVEFIEDIVITIRDGYELVPLPEGASYLGFMFARAPGPAQAEAALRAAYVELKIVVAPLIRLTRAR